jgi:spore coat polysaccharide biosynthesis protein SpsF
MRIGIVIQARIGSSRLPGKVLKNINNKMMVEHLIDKTKQVKCVDEIILAVSDNKNDDLLERVALKKNVRCFRGSENNVLERYLQSALRYNLDTIVRLTADCPLLSTKLLKESINKYVKLGSKPDYFYIEGYPNGLGAIEILSRNALIKSKRLARTREDKEHVVSFMLKNKSKFKVMIPRAVSRMYRPELRVCVDTIEDLKLVRIVAKHFQSTDINPRKLIVYLDNNPKLRKINEMIKQRVVI